MRLPPVIWFSSILLLFWCGSGPVLSTLPAQTPAPTPVVSPSPAAGDPLDDPLPGLVSYFDAIRRGDKPTALACWFNDVDGDGSRSYIASLIPHLIDSLIADYQLEQALVDKLPELHAQMQAAGRTTPDATRLAAAAKFTTFRRLAIVRWADGDEGACPMVYDNTNRDHGVWKISMQQWHETAGASVGDSFLLGGWTARATEMTAKDIRAGKVHTAEELQSAMLDHLGKLIKETEAPEKKPAPQGKAKP